MIIERIDPITMKNQNYFLISYINISLSLRKIFFSFIFSYLKKNNNLFNLQNQLSLIFKFKFSYKSHTRIVKRKKEFYPFYFLPFLRHDNSMETANAQLPRESTGIIYSRLQFTQPTFIHRTNHNFIHFLENPLLREDTFPYFSSSSKRFNLINSILSLEI